MVISTETVVIARPPAEVFSFTIDLRSQPLWDTEIESVSDGAGTGVEVGRRVQATYTPFLTESDGTITVLEVLRGERVVLRADFAGLTSRITYTYEREGDGTRFASEVEVAPTGMLRILAPVVRRRVRRSNRRGVANLKRVLEGR